MKTNASIETITKAVKTVSKDKYEGNVVFRTKPHNVTKNVVRFTLRTKDAEGLGSILTKNGQKHPKANWQVHLDIAEEIFRLEPKNNIYIDTIAGRLYDKNIPTKELVTSSSESKFIESLRYVLDNKEMLEKLLKQEKSPNT